MAAHQAPCPWDSPGKNTGVGCHFLLQCMKVKSQNEVAQSVQLLMTSWTAAYQAPPSMGFSRQEYWSGLPFPSPLNIFRTWKIPSLTSGSTLRRSHPDKASSVEFSSVTQACLTLCNSMKCNPTRLLCPWDFPGKNTGVGCHFLLQEEN